MYYNFKKIKNNFIKQIAKTKINKEKTNKTQLPQQNKKPQKQNKHKRVLCELASYPWAWGLHWSVASVPTDRHSIGEADFPLARRYQLQLASWLWVGLHIHFFYFAANFVSLNLARSWVCCHSPYVFIYESVPLYLGDVITPESSADSDSCNLSTSSSTKIPEP